MKRFLTALTLLLSISLTAPAAPPSGSTGELKAAPAYAALVARRAAAEAELAGLLASFTPSYPAVRVKRAELKLIGRELRRLEAPGGVHPRRLTAAYGDLLLRRIALRVELHDLLNRFTPRHPDVKQKRLEIAAVERALETLSR